MNKGGLLDLPDTGEPLGEGMGFERYRPAARPASSRPRRRAKALVDELANGAWRMTCTYETQNTRH